MDHMEEMAVVTSELTAAIFVEYLEDMVMKLTALDSTAVDFNSLLIDVRNLNFSRTV